MKLKQFRNAPTFAALQSLAVTIQTGTPAEISDHIDILRTSPLFAGRKAYQSMLAKLAALVSTGVPQYSIFGMKGNSKLPDFVAFSSLPAVTCPGAGDCLNFCYSFRAWRFAHSFGRQASAAYLMRFNRDAIADAFLALPQNVTLRLYVDGDFSSVADVALWFNLLRRRPDIAAYGYSKSFAEILAYASASDARMLPSNYQLNISGGHCHDAATVAAVAALPITRGEFISVSIGRLVKGSEHGTRETSAAVRKHAGRRVFVCPGHCSACTPRGHACGSPAFKNIPIAVAMH